jgi:hypothetical protein
MSPTYPDPLVVEIDNLRAEIERLRAALRDCIKSAEADGDLKASGWWDEQSIIAIENARRALEQKAGTE